MKKLLSFLLVAAAALPLAAGEGSATKISALSDVHTSVSRMPFYKDRRLEFFLTSSKISMQGTLLTAQWPVIDVIKRGVEVESISKSPVENGIDVIYRLHTPVPEVVDFWAKRPFSEGIITSASADVDQVRKMAGGKEKVYFRSPSLDLNGVGFTVDFTSRIITVLSEVEIDIRNAGANALGSSLLDTSERQPQEPEKEEIHVTRAFGDTLTIDVNQNLVTLSGNVRVFDDAGCITAETLEILLGKSEADSAAEESVPAVGNVKEVRFKGSVHAVRTLTAEEKLDGDQEARAQQATYQVQQDLLTLSGADFQQPILSRGTEFARANRIELRPKARRIEFFDNCRFEFAREAENGAKPNQPTVVTTRHAVYDDAAKTIFLNGAINLLDPMQTADLRADSAELQLNKENGSRPENVVASGNVSLARQNENVMERATAGKMTYQDNGQSILMEDSPKLMRGKDSISGDAMRYFVEEERLKVLKNCHIFIADTGNSTSTSLPVKSSDATSLDVTSDSADLNYGGNQLTFTQAVHIQGRGALLTADALNIMLKTVPGSSDKVPDYAVATGSVHAEDDSGLLDTERLEVRLASVAGGKTDVSSIHAQDGVRIQSRPDQNNPDASTLLGTSASGTTALTARRGDVDLLKNVADFYEEVKVFDGTTTLDCDHMHVIAKPAVGVVPTLDSYKENDEFPARLAIGSDRELESITAIDNVLLTRLEPDGSKQYAKGDYAYYQVTKRTIDLTAKSPKKPIAVTRQGGMTGDKVVIDLDMQDVMVENGDVLTHLSE